jgi:hypothetical protein
LLPRAQLDSEGLLGLLRKAGLVGAVSLPTFRDDPVFCLTQWLATFRIPRAMMTKRKILQQLRGELQRTEWKLQTLISTDGVAIVFHFRRFLSANELQRVCVPSLLTAQKAT